MLAAVDGLMCCACRLWFNKTAVVAREINGKAKCTYRNYAVLSMVFLQGISGIRTRILYMWGDCIVVIKSRGLCPFVGFFDMRGRDDAFRLLCLNVSRVFNPTTATACRLFLFTFHSCIHTVAHTRMRIQSLKELYGVRVRADDMCPCSFTFHLGGQLGSYICVVALFCFLKSP